MKSESGISGIFIFCLNLADNPSICFLFTLNNQGLLLYFFFYPFSTLLFFISWPFQQRLSLIYLPAFPSVFFLHWHALYYHNYFLSFIVERISSTGIMILYFQIDVFDVVWKVGFPFCYWCQLAFLSVLYIYILLYSHVDVCLISFDGLTIVV